MKKNMVVKSAAVMAFAGVCLLGAGAKADALQLTNQDKYRSPLVSVSAWGSDASYEAYNVTNNEKWDREDYRGVLVTLQDRKSGYINYDVYYASSTERLIYNDNKLYKFVSGWRPGTSDKQLKTINKDADRFERKADGSYQTLSDSGYSNSDRPNRVSGKIAVKNFRNRVKISISKWHESENGANFTLSKGVTDTWTRRTSRGNLLVVDDYKKYYVKPGEAISVFKEGAAIKVFADGKLIKAI